MKTIIQAFALCSLVALPMSAQTTPATAGHDHGNMEHATTASAQTTRTTTTTRNTRSTRTSRGASNAKQAVWSDTTRLAALLRDAQTSVRVPEATWRTIGNEANTLANRIYGHTAGSATARAAARDLRMHVREMRTAAMKGDAEGARHHASEAMPFAHTLITWAM